MVLSKTFSRIVALVLLATAASAQEGLFVCEEGICTSYTDGCNSCTAPDGNTALSACTEMFCECYNDDSCVPKCNDNDKCVPAAMKSEEMELCEPTGDESCPVARCKSPPEGCNYIFDHFVMQEDGQCCASLCYAVDAEGAHCPFEPVSEEGIVAPTLVEDGPNGTALPMDMPEDMNMEGMECIPEKEDEVTATARNADASHCPVAGCASPPEGCEYVPGPTLYDSEGHCCEVQCYAVDGDGKECSADPFTETESSASRAGLFLASSWIAAVVLLLGKN